MIPETRIMIPETLIMFPETRIMNPVVSGEPATGLQGGAGQLEGSLPGAAGAHPDGRVLYK